MSLKSIEMQVALPRSQDASRIQQHIQEQSTQFQAQTAERFRKESDMARKQVVKSDSKGENGLTHNQTRTSPKHIKSFHPFKGNQLDIRG